MCACAEGCKPNAIQMVNQYTGPVVSKQIESFSVTPPERHTKKSDEPPSVSAG